MIVIFHTLERSANLTSAHFYLVRRYRLRKKHHPP